MSEHWLQHAHGRIVAGDDELDVLADYGWVRLTDEEREAIEFAICSLGRDDYLNERHAEQLQETLERLKERLQ